jgi:hypothetical protein
VVKRLDREADYLNSHDLWLLWTGTTFILFVVLKQKVVAAFINNNLIVKVKLSLCFN